MDTIRAASPQFVEAVRAAVLRARTYPDDAIQYLSSEQYGIPVYAQYKPNPEQARAGGCADCLYLGLWASFWNGYKQYPHGLIWLFEEGIRAQNNGVHDEAYRVLLHEFQHALQRDHVLDAMMAKQASGMWRPNRPARGCNRCPGGR